jgi:hypothetical protein
VIELEVKEGFYIVTAATCVFVLTHAQFIAALKRSNV